MKALLQDERVRWLFDTWGEQTGLYRLADAVATESRHLARAAGVSHWTALAQDPAAVRRAPASESQVEGFEAAVEAYFGALRPANRPALDPRPAAFVRDTLGLPWGWLAYKLLDAFLRTLHARAFGPIQTTGYPLVKQTPLIPSDLRVTWGPALEQREFEVRAHPSVLASDVWRRLDETESMGRRGRRPNRDNEPLGQWARWFYCAKVKRPPESVAALAGEYMAHRHDRHDHITIRDAGHAVQVGIQAAERLLGLGS